MPPKKPLTTTARSMQLLPNQLSALGIGSNVNSTAISGRNSSVPAGRLSALSTSTSTSTTSLNNSRSGGGNINANGANGSEALSEEKRLKMAYANYLHQGVLAILMDKLAKKGAQVTRERVGGPAVQKEVDAFLKIKREYLYRDTWVGMLESCMTSTKLRDLFTELREQFVNGKEKTLSGLKIALESQFNRIFITGDDGGCSTTTTTSARENINEKNRDETKIKADEELEGLIQRAKDYVTGLDGGDDKGRRLSEDNPQFLAFFIQSMTELIKEHGAISSGTKETTDKVSDIVATTSKMISTQALKKRRRRKRNKKDKSKDVDVEAFEEVIFGGDETGDNLALNGNFPRSPSPIGLEEDFVMFK